MLRAPLLVLWFLFVFHYLFPPVTEGILLFIPFVYNQKSVQTIPHNPNAKPKKTKSKPKPKTKAESVPPLCFSLATTLITNPKPKQPTSQPASQPATIISTGTYRRLEQNPKAEKATTANLHAEVLFCVCF